MILARIMVLFACFVVIPTSGWAIDGYKSLKFGIKKEAVKKSKLCNFEEGPADPTTSSEMLICTNFMFNREKTEAYAIFVDNKFLRFIINVNPSHLGNVIESIGEKYGKASSGDSIDKFQMVEKFPNRQAFVNFDKDTITIKYHSDESGAISLEVGYTSPLYDKLYRSRLKAVMKNAL